MMLLGLFMLSFLCTNLCHLQSVLHSNKMGPLCALELVRVKMS